MGWAWWGDDAAGRGKVGWGRWGGEGGVGEGGSWFYLLAALSILDPRRSLCPFNEGGGGRGWGAQFCPYDRLVNGVFGVSPSQPA